MNRLSTVLIVERESQLSMASVEETQNDTAETSFIEDTVKPSYKQNGKVSTKSKVVQYMPPFLWI